ncbi:hypothetical protein J6590_034408 [Homalodisca vitripennis]|nr:hypothetical protein J6590_034408 [Homalodisca vitripennis]
MAHFLTKARRGWLLASYQRKHHRQCKAHISPCDNSGTLPGFSDEKSKYISVLPGFANNIGAVPGKMWEKIAAN